MVHQRSISRHEAASGCPPLIELAAYLDGRLDEAGAEAIELHLASCAECLAGASAVREAHAELRAGGSSVPEPVLEAARSLVPEPKSLGSSDRSWWGAGGLVNAGRWIAAAAAAIAVCAAGYHVGTSLPVVDRLDLAEELSFGLLAADDAEPGLLVLAAEEVGP